MFAWLKIASHIQLSVVRKVQIVERLRLEKLGASKLQEHANDIHYIDLPVLTLACYVN